MNNESHTTGQNSHDATLFQISTADAQSVSFREIGRELTADELAEIERRLGDYLDWGDCMSDCIRDHIETDE